MYIPDKECHNGDTVLQQLCYDHTHSAYIASNLVNYHAMTCNIFIGVGYVVHTLCATIYEITLKNHCISYTAIYMKTLLLVCLPCYMQ